MRLENTFIEICKNHLLIPEDKCLRCRISEDNRSAPCYSPVLMNRQYEGRSVLKEIKRQKDSHGKSSTGNIVLPSHDTPIDYYSCGQDQEYFDRFKMEGGEDDRGC